MSQEGRGKKRKAEEVSEEVTSQTDEALKEVEVHIAEVANILKRETLKVRKEKEAFDSVAKKLKHVHFSKTLQLNVGGQIFSTSLETLKKDPGTYLQTFSVLLKYVHNRHP